MEQHIVLFRKEALLFYLRQVEGETLRDLRAASRPWQRAGNQYLYFTERVCVTALDLITSGLLTRAELHRLQQGLDAAPTIPQFAGHDVSKILSQYCDWRHFGVAFAKKADAEAISNGLSLVTDSDFEIEVWTVDTRFDRERLGDPLRHRPEAAAAQDTAAQLSSRELGWLESAEGKRRRSIASGLECGGASSKRNCGRAASVPYLPRKF